MVPALVALVIAVALGALDLVSSPATAPVRAAPAPVVASPSHAGH